MNVDTHQHYWEKRRFDYGWIADGSSLDRDFMPGEVLTDMHEAGVDATVLVEAASNIDEIAWLLQIAERHEHIAGVVGWIDLTAPNAAATLDTAQESIFFKGVRLNWTAPRDNWETVAERMALLAERDLTCDLLLNAEVVPQLVQVIERQPAVRFVLDHFGGLRLTPSGQAEWEAAMKPLADLSNTVLKISGFMTAADPRPLAVETLRGYVDGARDLFGADRLLFGSDWPVMTRNDESYTEMMDILQSATHKWTAEDRSQLLGETAVRVYRLFTSVQYMGKL